MMKTVRGLILGCFTLLAAGVGYDVWHRQGSAPAAPPTESPPRSKPHFPSMWTGSASCVGRGCHGGIEPRTDGSCQQNEYTTIATQDPHARAYRVLFDERSRQMVRHLGRKDGNAHEDARCLTCHATPSTHLVRNREMTPSFLAFGQFDWTAPAEIRAAETAFGVGCESCHGPAAPWIHQHYEKSYRDGPRTNLAVDQTDVRARLCATCHVGNISSLLGGNVDHDLIAAGHPRLLFEFVSLQEALPPHWKPKRRDVSLEWYVGQIEGARAALHLLESRAQPHASPWPEFAEFDCFACHHDLKAKSWRQKLGVKHKPGVLPWNSWTYDVVIRLLEQHAIPTADWRHLKKTMEKMSERPSEKSLKAAEARLDELATFAPQWSRDKGGAAKMIDFLKRPDWATVESWEGAEQYYFALRALRSASDDPELKRRLNELTERRGFEPAFTSPRLFDPAEFFRR